MSPSWQNTLAAIGDWANFPWLNLLLSFLLSIVSAFLLRMLLTGVAARLAGKTSTDLDDRLIEVFNGPLVLAVVMYGLFYGLIHAFPNATTLHMTLRGAMLTVVILVWMNAFLKYGHYFIEYTVQKPGYKVVQPRTQPLFRILIKGLVFLGAAYFIIIAWDLNITGWLASAGVVGIAVGFAAKDTLANLISGIFIIADAPYQIGDFIVMDDGLRGRITDIGIRSTRMITRDDVEVIIPNAIIGNTRIVNQSGGPHPSFRLRVPVGVAYGSDIDQVEAILLEVAAAEPLVMKSPEARVRMRDFGESSLDFELLAWVENPELRGLALHNLLRHIYKAFARHQVEIPFPKRDVYLHQVDT